MKKDKFERLKEFCDMEGLELTRNPYSVVFGIEEKKDHWDGVEYARCVKKSLSGCFKEGFIYRRIPGTTIDEFDCLYYGENWTGSCAGAYGGTRSHFTTATESEYVDQLKEKVPELFIDEKTENIDYSELDTHPIAKKVGWVYNKIHDTLHLEGVPVYCSGKFAKVK